MSDKRVEAKKDKANQVNQSIASSGAGNKLKPSKGKESLIWTGILVVLALAIVANSIYAETVAMPIRIAGFIVLVVALMAASLLTRQGKSALSFIRLARGEMRRVVWPTRQETTQTTLLIIGVVLVAALIMWLFDSLFLYIVSIVMSI